MRDGHLTKEHLLDEATKLIQQKGMGAMSVNELLVASGIKRGALYHHFPGKDDLGLAVLERARTAFMDFIDAALDAPNPLDGLKRFFDTVLEWHRSHGFVGGCLFGNAALEMSDSEPRYRDFVRQVFQQWSDKIGAAVLAGQKAGQIRGDMSAGDLAQMVISTIEGGIMLSRLHKQEQPLKACMDSLKVFLRARGR